jgi:hypothetical protein
MNLARLLLFVAVSGGVGAPLLHSIATESQHSPSLSGCPALLEKGPDQTVSLDIAKATNLPGFVCVRVLNGFSADLGTDQQQGMRLQKQDEKEGVGGSFIDVERFPQETELSAEAGGVSAYGVADWWLPRSGKPAASGIYRVCFTYSIPDQPEVQEVCSQEFSLGKGKDIPPPPGCPLLPEQASFQKVSLYVAQASDLPGCICIRAINGLGEEVEYGAFAFWLQKWEEGEGQFHDLEEPDLRGTAVMLIAYHLPSGGVTDQRLPYSRQPAPPGEYRACLRFRRSGQSMNEETCSEKFSLP